MKTKLLLKSMLLLCALIAGSSSVWATDDPDVTYNFSSFTSAATVTLKADNNNLTITLAKNNGSSNPAWNSSASEARVYAKGSLNVSSASNPISKIVYTYVLNAGGKNNVTPTIDGVEGATNAGTWDATNKTWTGEDTEVTFSTSGTAGNVGFTKIEVWYKVDNRTAVNLTSFTADKTTLVVGETQATSVSNDQAGWTAAYTYTSDDEDVATISATGVITAVGKGSTKVWAELNVDKDDEDYKKGATIKRSIDITVVNPSHKATFYVNGNKLSEVDVEEGEAITFPSDPSSIGGKDFIGWIKEVILGTTNTAPTSYYASDNMGTSDVNFYAVYATKSVTGGEVTKSYGFETASDDDWTIDGPARSTDYANSGSYSGKINTNNTYVTFKNKVKVTEFSFAFTRASGNNNYNVYIETRPDENSSWTAAETYAMSTFNSDGTFSTKTKTFDGKTELYVRFHCYNTTAVRYVDDVTITYNDETVSYSEYCTSITVPITITCEGGYASYSCDTPLDFTNSEAEAYIIKSTSENSAALTKVTKVPANTGIIVKGTKGETVNVTAAIGTMDDVEGNLLHGTVNTPVDVEKDEAYGLSKYDGLFHLMNAGTIPANKAYLLASEVFQSGDAAPILGLDLGSGTTGINAISNSQKPTANGQYYNLNGQRVAQPTKGLYIVNGKKIVIK